MMLSYIEKVKLGSVWVHKESGKRYTVDSFCYIMEFESNGNGCHLRCEDGINISIDELRFFDIFEELK